MNWTRRSTWRKLRDKPVVFLANPENRTTGNAEALWDLFDLMANVRMQPGVHRFVFGPDCRLDYIARHDVDQGEAS